MSARARTTRSTGLTATSTSRGVHLFVVVLLTHLVIDLCTNRGHYHVKGEGHP